MSLAKLTSLSTQTLTLLLERQRIQSLPTSPAAPTTSLHVRQITKNLQSLRKGILELQEQDGSASEAVVLLKNQYERMRAMLGSDGVDTSGIETLEQGMDAAAPVLEPPRSSSPPMHSGSFTPYTDDPDGTGQEPNELVMHTHRQMMDEQDVRLDHLSLSITRQHHISLQINDELEVHTGLLEGLDQDLDQTHSRLGGARRRLDRIAKGAKENGSTMTIGLLILVLLLLIIIFKT